MRLTELAHQQISPLIKAGSIAIDATVGNGFDTLFLAESVGRDGRVYGFDVQPLAIELATLILTTRKCADRCQLFEVGHESMVAHLPESSVGKVAVVMFNLGYLPHGDKSITTQPLTTLAALEQAFKFLKPGGILSILSYRGHPGGLEEFRQIQQWLNSMQAQLSPMLQQDSANPDGRGPFLWLMQKT